MNERARDHALVCLVLFLALVAVAQSTPIRRHRDPVSLVQRINPPKTKNSGTNSDSEAFSDLSADIDVHVYVLNLADRKDRWECMKRQLANSPYPVSRFDATTPNTISATCPNVKMKGDDGNRSKMGLKDTTDHDANLAANFCSNYNLWRTLRDQRQETQSRRSNSDFFAIVLEDDVALASGFWSRVQELLRGGCHDWDLLRVDTFFQQDNKPLTLTPVRDNDRPTGDKCKRESGEFEPVGGVDGEGTHATIIRHTAFSKLLHAVDSKGAGLPMDHWGAIIESDPHKLAVLMWQPNVVSQVGEWKTFNVQPFMAHCNASVGNSDVDKANSLNQLLRRVLHGIDWIFSLAFRR